MGSEQPPLQSRRRFLYVLGGVGLSAGIGLTERRVVGGQARSANGPGRVLPSELPAPPRFTVPLPRIPVIKPARTTADADHYEVTQRAAKVEIIPGTRTTVWGFEGRFPGPTFEARSGRKVVVRMTNELPAPTSTHLHGGVTPAESDGYPTDLILPAGYELPTEAAGHMSVDPSVWTTHEVTRAYEYPLQQRAQTLWYHDHRMDFSAPQVWRGLLGSFLVRDDEEDALPLPAGEREVSLLICDRSFAADGSFKYPGLDPDLRHKAGVSAAYAEGVLGDVILVNGAPWPRLEVANTRYRLRVLNASNARRYRLALDPAPRGASPFVQIGSDNGLLAAPRALDGVPISPGERHDVVVDFSAYPIGAEVTLVNTFDTGRLGQVMRFHVTRRETDDSSIPRRLSSYERLDRAQAKIIRSFDFRRGPEHVWTINGRPFNPAEVVAEPALDSVELWVFSSDFHHPVHVHMAHFQVINRAGRTPGPHEGGWKDTVYVGPHESVAVLVKFSGYRGRYMLHCHNLEHEDMAMMANFDVV